MGGPRETWTYIDNVRPPEPNAKSSTNLIENMADISKMPKIRRFRYMGPI